MNGNQNFKSSNYNIPKLKFLVLNIRKYIQYSSAEYYKTLMEEFEDLIKLRNIYKQVRSQYC